MWIRRVAVAALTAVVVSCGPSPQDPAEAVEPAADEAPVDPAPAAAEAPAADDWEAVLRPTHVDLIIRGGNNSGEYHSRGIHRLCGRLPAMGKPLAWTIDSPEGDVEISSVSFGADELLAGDVTTKFHLNVVVHAKDGGQYPAYVVRAGDGESGEAKLTIDGDTASLRVNGVNGMKEEVDLSLTCGPRT